jgi:hypothetical protein
LDRPTRTYFESKQKLKTQNQNGIFKISTIV